MKIKQIILFGLLIVLMASCDNTKYLGANQNLFIGSTEKIKSTEKISKGDRKDLEEEMHALVRPNPNTSILGVRFKLTVFNMFKEPKKKKGLIYWLKYKVGEPPVIASYSALEKNREVIENHLDNKGYFRDSVVMDTSIKHKKLKVTYTALLGAQYKIDSTSYPNDSSALAQQIQATALNKKEVLLKPNDAYDLDMIKNERIRVDANLKEHGYYYFSPDYLLANVDSTVGNHKVDIDMSIKPETPDEARVPYYIKDVYVFPDYGLHQDTSLRHAKKFEGYTIIDPRHKFNPKIFSRTLVFKPGDIYNRTDHNLSLNRLITLGVYKFVKVRFQPGDSAQTLDAYYYLTPTNKKSIRFQVSALQRSDNATGTEFTINWRNRNTFKGAELLTIAANAGIEKQISSGVNVNTLTAGVEADLYVPRILAPFHLNTSSAFVPQTKFSAGYQLYNRTSEYLLTSITGSYGYVWKNSITNEQQLTPININYVQPANITADFQNQIIRNPALSRSLEKQFIIGGTYNYNYNSLAKPNTNTNNFYFNGNVDVSGNVLGLITGANADKGKQKEIFSTPFTQYVRFEADFRHYLRLGNQFRSFNTRLDAGIGYAYGNSSTMPFIKEFFAGGVSDLRGFKARMVGPGSYYPLFQNNLFLIDQPGDVKLLGMFEYRAKLFSIVRYALFSDAGNVWTLKNDPFRPGSKFTSNFLSQMAVDAGAGLRFDINILVLRLDVAFPVRLPYALPDGSSYKINFGSSQWRKDNLVFNLAIGYPF
ncbi:MAG TPA: BamA/TamA family outer membrane protein [Parafilimonas sp.]|nr:BamA/TamA family outer membrane protein [Parafilimonas sp.]